MTKDGAYQGYCVDFLTLLADAFPEYNFELHLVKDNKYGAQENGKWNGMIGELTREVSLSSYSV